MIILDFTPGSHGHFLEYVVNRYIYRVDVEIETIFQSSGASHFINLDKNYQNLKQVRCGHFSVSGRLYPDYAEKIIWIKHNPAYDFVLLTNTFYRCHPQADNSDVDIEAIKTLHLDTMFSKSARLDELRNNWYTKLTERHFSQSYVLRDSDLPRFNFEFSTFFYLDKFVEELQRLSVFLNVTFVFDQSLVVLWEEFIDKNQGVAQYWHARKLVNAILSNTEQSIDPNNWQVQAYINQQLSSLFRMYDGITFTADTDFPISTKTIHQLVLQHIQDFDSRF